MLKVEHRKSSLTDLERDICESLGWTIHEYDDGIELSQYSPAGEDFSFSVSADRFVQDVKQYAADFDIDEHIEMWIEARRHGVSGVPSTRELVEDAEEIKKMLQELATKIAEEFE